MEKLCGYAGVLLLVLGAGGAFSQPTGSMTYSAFSAPSLAAVHEVPIPTAVLLPLGAIFVLLGYRSLRRRDMAQSLGVLALFAGMGSYVIGILQVPSVTALPGYVELDNPAGGTVSVPEAFLEFRNTTDITLKVDAITPPASCKSASPGNECVAGTALASGASCNTEFTCLPSAAHSTLSGPAGAVDVGTAANVGVTLRNSTGALYGRSGGLLNLTATPAGLIINNVQDNGGGTYSAQLSSTVPATYSVSAEVGGVTLVNTLTVTFEQSVSALNSTFTPASAVQKTNANVPMTITLRDEVGNIYSQSGGTLSVVSVPAGVTTNNLVDNGNGTYSFNAMSSAVGTFDVAATVGGVTLDASPQLTFTEVDAANTTVSPSNLVVVVGTPQTVAVTLRQLDNSLVGHGGHAVTVSSTFIDSLGIVPAPSVSDNGDGTYTLTQACTVAIGASDSVTVFVDGVSVGSYSLDCD